MPPRVTAQQAAQKWQQRIGQATQQITDGVNRVTVAPAQAAVAQKAKWQQNTAAAADKWARNTGRVTLDQWKTAMLGIGVARIAPGAQAKVGKVESFMGEVLPHIDRGQQMLTNMPSTTLEDNIARSTAWIRHMASFKRAQ